MLSEKEMRKFLSQRSETASLDYKRALPSQGQKTCNFLDLLRDLVAMANTNGGTIIFGVEDNNYNPIGLKGKRTLDETNLTQAFENYLACRPDFTLTFWSWKEKDFAFLTIEKRQFPLVFHKPAQCTICREKAPSKHFYPGATFVRNGSQTIAAPEHWYTDRLNDLNLLERSTQSVMNNLPSRYLIYDRFVGREPGLQKILELLKDERRRISWITGSGGIGKTAVAFRAAEKILANENLIGDLDYLVWLSAKDDALTLSGVEKRQSTLNSLSDLIKAIDRTTDHASGISQQHISIVRKATDALELLNDVLSNWTGLIILDNLETLEDEEVYLFLQHLPGKTRALVTTREAGDRWGGDTVKLEPMTNVEAIRLIKTEALRCGNSWLEANEDAVHQVLELSGRIPLAIRLIVPRLNSRSVLKSYRAVSGVYHKELLEFCYERTFNNLSEDQQYLLFSIALFDDSASLRDLTFILDVSEHDSERYENFKSSLSILWTNSLVRMHLDGIEPRYELHNLVKEYVLRKLGSNAKTKRCLQKRFNFLEQRNLKDIRKLPSQALAVFSKNHDYNKAVSLIEKCLNYDPDNVDALLTRVNIELIEKRNLNIAMQAAGMVFNGLKVGSEKWIEAAIAIAKIESINGNTRSALENTLYALNNLRKKSCVAAQLTLLAAKYYMDIALSDKVDKENVRANFLECADYAKKAFLQSHKLKEPNLLEESLLLWAKAAKYTYPAVSYQVAELGLNLAKRKRTLFANIRYEVERELNGIPKKDLLNLPKEFKVI